MAIDTNSEQLISLTDATKILPKRRAGKRPNVATLYRWAQIGMRGIRLEYSQIAGTKCTSREALQRFFDALTEQAESGRSPVPQPAKLSALRRKQIEAAEKRLQAAGI
jgi:hypothetical protein